MSHSSKTVVIQIGETRLVGDLDVPEHPHGVVVFVHGSGSSRLSPRNRFVAEELRKDGFGTLLFDLLTADEDSRYSNRFDIDLLTRRLAGAVEWLRTQPNLDSVPLGLFGASTGAAAALRVAARNPETVAAVVSRGGRPDLAHEDLGRVSTPSLLIVGSLDTEVLQLNEDAMRAMPATTTKRLDVVSGATHLFEEPGALEKVTRLARDWFETYAAVAASR
jgi:putative phosphoribosyl transferase